MLLCKTGSQHACVTAITPMKICCSHKCAVIHHRCTAALVLANCIPHCPMLLCKTGSQHACVTAITPTEICCSHKRSVIHHKSTAALVLAIAFTTLSHAALQNRLTACLCHCNYTYEDLLLTQVCSDPPQKHCSPGFGKLHSTLSSAALQNRLTACLCHCNYTYEICCSHKCAVIHHKSTAALVLANCIPHCPMLLCKTGSQHACVTAITPTEICCSHKCAVIHHKSTAALVLAIAFHTVQMLLCKTGSQHACVTAITPMRDLLLTQVCSDPPPKHCSPGFGKLHSTLSPAALQNRLTACLCHCNYTYRDLLLTQALCQ